MPTFLLRSLGPSRPTRRYSSFALLAMDERSFGVQVIGVVPETEQQISTLTNAIAEGRYLRGGQEAVVGNLLANNLGAALGDELVVLGTGPEGGVAARLLERLRGPT